MGKTDVRSAAEVAARHPGVVYEAIDLTALPADELGTMLREVMSLFERGVLQPLPVRAWDVRSAKDAFRFVAQAKHVGKVVLRVPRPLDPSGTVVITGGTGALGALVAKHLVMRHGVRRLLLLSRAGQRSTGADELYRVLAEAGADVRIEACDVADRSALAAALARVPKEHPLTAVVHAAGVLDDAPLCDLTPARFDAVLAPKVDGALALSALTEGHDLSAFVLFSSIAGTVGGAAQSNYAAANAFLDALAHHRGVNGLPALSLAWGLWADRSGMTAKLGTADVARLARRGMGELTTADALAALDEALERPDAVVAPVRLIIPAQLARVDVHPLLRALVRSNPRHAAASNGGPSLSERIRAAGAEQRAKILLEIVEREIIQVLGFSSAGALDAARPLKELGLDSLMAVELKNRLAAATGLRLETTLVFDHPTPEALVRRLLSSLNPHDERVPENGTSSDASDFARKLDTNDDASLFALIDKTLQMGKTP
jgi:NAD(P)-dependent dehydrogenase (short-subunit alcohol dehydrogenase family)